jgi:hypothetical protein
MNADDTPPTSARTRYGIQMVSCRASRSSYGCVTWQKYSCYEEYCRTEYYAYADCFDNTTGSCDTELGALQACMDADADATACLTERVRACFP